MRHNICNKKNNKNLTKGLDKPGNLLQTKLQKHANNKLALPHLTKPPLKDHCPPSVIPPKKAIPRHKKLGISLLNHNNPKRSPSHECAKEHSLAFKSKWLDSHSCGYSSIFCFGVLLGGWGDWGGVGGVGLLGKEGGLLEEAQIDYC